MSVMADMDTTRENIPEIVRTLKRIADVNDEMIGTFLGLKLGSARNRVAGDVPWSPWELVGLAEFFGVEVEVFYMSPDEAVVAAVTKYKVHEVGFQRRSEQGKRPSTWNGATAGQSTKAA